MSDYLDREIFPRLYEMAPHLLSEFDFKPHGDKLISSNKRKIDGSEGDKLGAVYIYKKTPFYIHDFTRGGKAILNYLYEQGKFSSKLELIQHLARQLGAPPLEHSFSEEQIKKTEEKHHKINFYESINDYFVNCLNDENCKEALKYREYIKGRGYAGYKLSLGFIPSQEALKKHLISLKFSLDEIDKNFFNCTIPFIGSSHRLTIPFENNRGDLVSFVFRDIQLEEGNKYLFMKEFKKTDYLFYLKNNRKNKNSIVLVEGFLDSMTPHIHGMDNVVALGGLSISDEQIKLIKETGSEKIILCLDGDKPGIEATPYAINKILSSGIMLPLYVVSWPDSCSHKDPDELIKAESIDSFKSLIENAKSWFNYLASNALENVTDNISNQERDIVIKNLISIGSKIKKSTDRDSFYSEVDQKGEYLKISRDTLQAEIERERLKQEEKKYIETIRKETEKAVSHLNNGDKNIALEVLGNISKHKNNDLLDSYQALLTPITEDTIRECIKNKPDHLISGLKINNEDLLIPSGALTIIAAPTSHGKTTLLGNIGINIATQINNKPVYLFSYEESREAVLLKLLNTYINKPLSKNNYRSIESYFKNGDMGYISSDMRETFIYEKDKFFSSLIQSGKLNVFYSDYTSEDLIGAIHYLHKQDKVSAVLIDYVQLLRLKNNKSNSRQEEVKQICLDLKDCAVKTGLPIILGAQFNREVNEKAAIHATKIGEAGDIERISNFLIGIWNNKFADYGDKNPKLSDTIDAFILKDRHGGMTGMKQVFSFNGNTGKISNDGIKIDNNVDNSLKRSKLNPLSVKDYSEAKNGS